MKIISIILVIIIAGSTVVPCGDTGSDFSNQLEMITINGVDPGSPIDFDFCPPLCSCHCCHSHITGPVILSYTIHFQPFQEIPSQYTAHLSGISISVWQPPKTT